MLTNLVEKYQRGQITAGHLVVQCLHMIDPNHPDIVLDELPPEVLERLLAFTKEYRPEGMVTNYGVLPAVDQIEAAQRWIEAKHAVPH